MTRRSLRHRRSTLARRSASLGRSGFSLLECLFALVGTSIATIGMAGMLLHASLNATQISGRGARAAVAIQQLNRLAALPYDSLDSQAGCVNRTTAPFPHRTCIAITPLVGGAGGKTMQLIITPLSSSIKPDTSFLTRSKGTTNPLVM
jgi:hypothetical protein